MPGYYLKIASNASVIWPWSSQFNALFGIDRGERVRVHADYAVMNLFGYCGVVQLWGEHREYFTARDFSLGDRALFTLLRYTAKTRAISALSALGIQFIVGTIFRV